MKPLTLNELPAFIERFSSFKDAEFRSLNIISPLQIQTTFAVQDSARAFDWITITLEFNGVSDARLLESSRLYLVDMSEGANILKEDTLFAFGIGECYNISTIKSSSCYIIANTLKYEEGLF
ncbi:hypothetical protein JHD49_05435 [Sulfurimonas sp. SAG-AH-194-C21]|nr:hypothetical protein [Sulfurimonas sp. SAG-AH-194-C21]MDF1883379.1 hypothetical protein [Sulfurimonas sp. SAG-AH-194-C21]